MTTAAANRRGHPMNATTQDTADRISRSIEAKDKLIAELRADFWKTNSPARRNQIAGLIRDIQATRDQYATDLRNLTN